MEIKLSLSVSQNSCGRDIAAISTTIQQNYFRGEIDKAIRSHNPLTLILDYSQVDLYEIAQVSGYVLGRYRR